jgi:hypothetical protein
MAKSIEQLSFELTSGSLAEQERALAGLRARAGTVLAAASIAGSFFAAEASHGRLDVWGVLAMVAFALCVACAIVILLPHTLVFVVNGEELLVEVDDFRALDLGEAYRTAGRWIEPQLEVNRDKIAMLSNWLASSCLLLGVEIVFWTVSLVS